jgi:hypothetical protein
MAVLTHTQLEQVWILAGGSNATADTAAAIAQAESGGDTSRINNTAYPLLPGYHPVAKGDLPEYSVGLWQINELAHPQYTTAQLLTQLGNANAAVAVANGGASFSPWSTYKDGAYKAFLQSGGTPAAQPGTVTVAPAAYHPARAFSGYADLRQSVNHHLANQLERSKRTNAATLRVLTHRRRVGH